MERIDELMELLVKTRDEYEIRIRDIEDKVDMIEEFLIRNTRGHYLKNIKKDSYR